VAQGEIWEVQPHGDVEGGAGSLATAEEPKLSQTQKALRWKNHVASICMYIIVAFSFGASPLVDSMNSQANEMSSAYHWLAPGITTFATLLACSNIIIPLTVGSVLKLLKYKGMLIWLTSLAGALLPLSIGIATSTGQLWIAYLGAVLASPAFFVGLESSKVMVVQWWALDGKQRQGVALSGLMIGIMFLLMTLALGYTCQYWGVAWTGYAMAILFATLSLWPLYLALRGELGPPQPVGAKVNMPSAKKEYFLWSFSFCQICFHNLATILPSFGMKMLLTSIFQSSYDVPFLTSANMSSLTLVLYAIARGACAYLAKPGVVFPMQIAMLLLTGALYGSYAAIIQHLPIWCLVIAKTITGGCFAAVMGMQSLTLLEVYEPEELSEAFTRLQPFAGSGFAFGPVIGYYINLVQKSRGVGDQSAYNLFFYLSAALYLAAAANMTMLHHRLSTRPEKAQAHE